MNLLPSQWERDIFQLTTSFCMSHHECIGDGLRNWFAAGQYGPFALALQRYEQFPAEDQSDLCCQPLILAGSDSPPVCTAQDVRRVQARGANVSVAAFFDFVHDWHACVTLGPDLLQVLDLGLFFKSPRFGGTHVPAAQYHDHVNRVGDVMLSQRLSDWVGMGWNGRYAITVHMEKRLGRRPEDEVELDPYQKYSNSECYVGLQHHLSHALYAFYDSPFSTALIVTMDGGGSDGTNHFYWGDRAITSAQALAKLEPGSGSPLKFLGSRSRNIARAYLAVGWLLKAIMVVSPKMGLTEETSSMLSIPWLQDGWRGHFDVGLIMDYSTLGTAQDHWQVPCRRLFNQSWAEQGFDFLYEANRLLMRDISFYSDQDVKDFAASAQGALEDVVADDIERRLAVLPSADGVALAGGVAYNSLLVSAIARRLHPKRVHVPCAPGDEGLGIGMLYYVQPPLRISQPLCHAGLWYTGRGGLWTRVKYRKRAATATLVGSLLASGSRVAVIRGQTAIGQTGQMGARSVLVSPHEAAQLRQQLGMFPFQPMPILTWWHNVRTLTKEVFTTGCISYAPELHKKISMQFPAVVDGNGCGRVYVMPSEHEQQEPDRWLQDVVLALMSFARLPAPFVVEVPFKRANASLINDIGSAFQEMDRGAIDALVVNLTLYTPRDI